jgi:hypothetical protein
MGWGTDPYTGKETYLTFYAGAGGATGYLSMYDWTQGVNEVNGQFYSNSEYQDYLEEKYARQISAQCGTVGGNLSASFPGSGASVDCSKVKYIQGSHANFSVLCGTANGGNCAGRWADGLHIEGSLETGFWGHNDSASFFIGSGFNWGTFSPGNLFLHGTVDVIYGTAGIYMFPH